MSDRQRSSDEFLDLLDAVCEDSHTPEQLQRLESILRQDEHARQEYRNYMQANLELSFAVRSHRLELAARDLRLEEIRDTRSSVSCFLCGVIEYARRPKTLSFVSIAALLLVILTVTGLVPTFQRDQRPTAFNSEGVARLTRTADLKWSDPSDSLVLGEYLQAGRHLEIAEGVAEITLNDGAKVSVAGPAALQVTAAMAIELFAGSLTADVSVRGVGFVVDMPNARVIDKGTAFGVKVNEDGEDEIHVFEGRVDAFLGKSVDQSYDKQLQLHEGQSAKFDVGHSRVQLRGANRTTFPTSLQQRAQNEVEYENTPEQTYTLSQSYGGGQSPGNFAIEGDVINLRAGSNNTVCVMLDDPRQQLETGERLEVLAPALIGEKDGVFLMVSTIPEQADGASSYCLRLRRDERGIWLMKVEDPNWVHMNFPQQAKEEKRILPDPGGPLVLSIVRVSDTTFRCYYRTIDGTEPVLIGETSVTPMASCENLYVGVQAYCYIKTHTYSFKQLNVVAIEDHPNRLE